MTLVGELLEQIDVSVGSDWQAEQSAKKYACMES